MYNKKDLKGKMGVYQIRNIIDNKVYIGSSYDIASRWTEHQRDLRKNEHKNLHLQNAYNKYGVQNFVYEMLEIIDSGNTEEQFSREQYWINSKGACNKEKGYNIQSEVLVVPKAVKKVVCLETKEVFNSTKEASVSKGIDAGSISCCCNKRKLKTAGGFHWVFYDEYIEMSELEIEEVLVNVRTFPFICLDNGKIYRSWKELPYKKGLIARCCNKLAKKEYARCSGKMFLFLKDYKKFSPEEIEVIRNLKPNNSTSGEIICLETGVTYRHARDAMLKTGIADTGILNCCYRKSVTCGGYHWLFKKDYNKLSPNEVISIIQRNGKENIVKPIICLETKEIFESGAEASKRTGTSRGVIFNMCKKGGINTKRNVFHFMYLKDYSTKSEKEIKDIIECKNLRLRKVKCIETGKVFESVTDAAKYVKGETSNISKCCKNSRYMCKGYHWQYV